MAKFYDSFEDLEDDYDFDVSELTCPKCGCNDVEVLKYPKDTTSWGGRTGKAGCRFCRIVFPIRIRPDDEF